MQDLNKVICTFDQQLTNKQVNKEELPYASQPTNT